MKFRALRLCERTREYDEIDENDDAKMLARCIALMVADKYEAVVVRVRS